jgi:excisionase family DNA binding protein
VSALLTSLEVAEMLGVNPKTIDKMARQRRIPYVAITQGRRTIRRFDPQSIAEWIRANEQQAVAS